MSTSYAQCSSASIKSFVQFFAIFPRIYTTVYGHNCIHSYTTPVWNKHTPKLIIFSIFFQGLRPYSGLHRAYLSSISLRYKWGYAYSFCQIFQGPRLFKGVHLFQAQEYSHFFPPCNL
jgi:hypothetical protein